MAHNRARKKGSGRPKGATSFTEVKLGDIYKLIGPENENELVPVSRVWLEKKGFTKALDLCSGKTSQ
tara:strand:- start:314 stop:514 length:201 start_codon:yes stop_codon:yes gene_type:complete